MAQPFSVGSEDTKFFDPDNPSFRFEKERVAFVSLVVPMRFLSAKSLKNNFRLKDFSKQLDPQYYQSFKLHKHIFLQGTDVYWTHYTFVSGTSQAMFAAKNGKWGITVTLLGSTKLHGKIASKELLRTLLSIRPVSGQDAKLDKEYNHIAKR